MQLFCITYIGCSFRETYVKRAALDYLVDHLIQVSGLNQLLSLFAYHVLFIVEWRLETFLQLLEQLMALDVILVVREEADIVIVNPLVEVNEHRLLSG